MAVSQPSTGASLHKWPSRARPTLTESGEREHQMVPPRRAQRPLTSPRSIPSSPAPRHKAMTCLSGTALFSALFRVLFWGKRLCDSTFIPGHGGARPGVPIQGLAPAARCFGGSQSLRLSARCFPRRTFVFPTLNYAFPII